VPSLRLWARHCHCRRGGGSDAAEREYV
jgi:hypothetical protein